MLSTQKGLATGLSVCDRDRVVICTWSALSTHLWCRLSPPSMGPDGTEMILGGVMSARSCWSISLHQMWPLLKEIQPLRPVETCREHACVLERMFVSGAGVEGWAGRGRCVLDSSSTDERDAAGTHVTSLLRACAHRLNKNGKLWNWCVSRSLVGLIRHAPVRLLKEVQIDVG